MPERLGTSYRRSHLIEGPIRVIEHPGKERQEELALRGGVGPREIRRNWSIASRFADCLAGATPALRQYAMARAGQFRLGVVIRHQLRLRARHLGEAFLLQPCRLLVEGRVAREFRCGAPR